MTCPKCSGPMWDNRNNKRNPKSPDFKCKNRECGHAIWEQRERSGPGMPAAAPANGKWTWGQLAKLYEGSLKIAEKTLAASAARTKLPLTSDNLLAGAATLFIAASRDGIRPVAPPPPPPPAPEQLPEPPEDWGDEEY